MSLTQFLKNADVRDLVDESFPNQGSGTTESLKAGWQTQNYTLIGTAFDYLLRFWLRKHTSEFHARPWVAEQGASIAEERFPEEAPEVREAINRAEEAQDDFLDSGQVTRPLVESALDLARIDTIYRAGAPPTNLGEYDDRDIVDCIRLIEILADSDALDGETVHLNPAFGLASALVGGADADLVLDGTLVDVKTTGKSTFKIDYWRQLVGYLTLADIHNRLFEFGIYDQLGLEGDSDIRPLPEIDRFGVYFSRHGDLVTLPTRTIYEAEEYPHFRSTFIETALNTYDPYGETLDEMMRTLL